MSETKNGVRPTGRFDANRAARGRTIVCASSRRRNSNDNIGDVLLDLMHYAAQRGKDFEAELAFARRAFAEDTGEGP